MSEEADALEIEAMTKVARILRALPYDSRRRVVAWLQDRFAGYENDTRTWDTPVKGNRILTPKAHDA